MGVTPHAMEGDVLREAAMRVRQAQLARGYVIEACGLRVMRDLSPEEWAVVGQEIATGYRSHAWALGDWLVRGEGLRIRMGRPRAGDATGSIYERAMRLTGLSHGTLYSYARTAREWAFETRVPAYGISLHEVALRLPNHSTRVRILRQAAEAGWSAEQVDEEVTRHQTHLPTWPAVARRRAKAQARAKPGITCPHCGKHITRAQVRLALKGGTA